MPRFLPLAPLVLGGLLFAAPARAQRTVAVAGRTFALDRPTVPCAVPVPLVVDRPGRRTVALRRVDADGDTVLVRTLARAQPFDAGTHTLCWDGFGVGEFAPASFPDSLRRSPGSDPSLLYLRAAPGRYVVDVLALDSLVVRYSMTVGNGPGLGAPGWAFAPHQGWLGEHDAPADVAVLPRPPKGGYTFDPPSPFGGRLRSGPQLALTSFMSEVYAGMLFLRADSLRYSAATGGFGGGGVAAVAVDRGRAPENVAATFAQTYRTDACGIAPAREAVFVKTLLGTGASFDNNDAAGGGCGATLPYASGEGDRRHFFGLAAYRGRVFAAVAQPAASWVGVVRVPDVRQNEPFPEAVAGRIALPLGARGGDFLDRDGRQAWYFSAQGADAAGSALPPRLVRYTYAPDVAEAAFADSAVVLGGAAGWAGGPALTMPVRVKAVEVGRMGNARPLLLVADWGMGYERDRAGTAPMPQRHTVEVYEVTPAGALRHLRTVGTPGGPAFGPFDPARLDEPWGFDVVAPGPGSPYQTPAGGGARPLLVVSGRGQTPRRTTLFDARTGALVDTWYGTPSYAGGGQFGTGVGTIPPDTALTQMMRGSNGGVVRWRLDYGYGPDGRLGGGDDRVSGRARVSHVAYARTPYYARAAADALGVPGPCWTADPEAFPEGEIAFRAPDGRALRYATNAWKQEYSPGTVVLWRLLPSGLAVPAAAVGSADHVFDALGLGALGAARGRNPQYPQYVDQIRIPWQGNARFHRERTVAAWSDADGDCRVGADEVVLHAVPGGGASLLKGWSVSADLTVWHTDGHRVALAGVDARGTPRYALDDSVDVRRFRFPVVLGEGDGHAAGGQPGPQDAVALPAPLGRSAVGAPPALVRTSRQLAVYLTGTGRPARDGKRVWAETVPAYQYAPPGAPQWLAGVPNDLTIGPGPPVVACPAWAGALGGSVWGAAGANGDLWLYAADGALVGELGADSRRVPNWMDVMPRRGPGPDAWPDSLRARGTDVTHAGWRGENYRMHVATVRDDAGGCRLVILSGGDTNVFEVAGLETARRTRAALDVPAAALAALPDGLVQRFPIGAEDGVYAVGTGPVRVDGRLDEWPDAAFRLVDAETGTEMALRRTTTADGAGALAVALRSRAFALGTRGACPWERVWECGGGVDVWLARSNDLAKGDPNRIPVPDPPRPLAVGDQRLYLTRAGGRWLAVQAAPHPLPGCAAGTTVRSPLGTTALACVRDVTARVDAAGDARALELVVPDAVLGGPLAGRVLGDFGVVVGGGADAQRRAYWNNRSQRTTYDASLEAAVFVQHWGTLVLPPGR